MIPHIKKFFLIIVHHGEAAPTDRLLESISGSPAVPDYVFLIDQAEVPYQLPPAASPTIRLIRPHLNAGYAAGINIGLGAAYAAGAEPADIIICANNDIGLDTAALTKIRAWWAKRGEGHILGARFGVINLFTGRSRLTASQKEPQRPWEILYLDGALFSLPLGTFFDLSGMGSEYMLYWEDAAFSQKAARRGATLHALNLPLHHPSDTVQNPSNTKLYYLVRNGAHFLAHETALPWRLFWQLKNRLRLIYHRLSPGHAVIHQALTDALKSQLGPRV